MTQNRERVVSIIVDGSNLVRSLWDYTGDASRGITPERLDIRSMHKAILAGRSQGTCRLFRSRPPPDKESYLSFSSLQLFRKLGYGIRTSPLIEKRERCFNCRHSWDRRTEKPVDARIVNMMWKMARDGNEVVVISGDSDFLEAAETLLEGGASVKFWGVSGSISHEITGNPYFMGGLIDPFIRVGARA